MCPTSGSQGGATVQAAPPSWGLHGPKGLHLLLGIRSTQGGVKGSGPQSCSRPASRLSVLTCKVGVYCHPAFSWKTFRGPNGWFCCKAYLRLWERGGKELRCGHCLPRPSKGHSLHLPRVTSSSCPGDQVQLEEHPSSSLSPRWEDLPDPPASQGNGTGSQASKIGGGGGTWTSQELYRRLCRRVTPRMSHSRPLGVPPPKPGRQVPTTPSSPLFQASNK